MIWKKGNELLLRDTEVKKKLKATGKLHIISSDSNRN